MKASPALFGALLFLTFGTTAWADAEISGLKVTLDGDRALVSLRLKNGISRRLLDRIESGLPTQVVYELELARDRKRWYDQGLARATLELTAVFDAVARETSVHYRLGGELIESRTVRDRPGVMDALSRIERVPAFSLGGLAPGVRYLVRARAILGTHTVLAIIPADIRTDWAESNKFRRPAAP
ncbi:MAG TPA: DUF4390 domain-containing protein [Thermoanaerobaculia bacterium]|nr:DUF4390 domain-containing protein [Thermoanaerobaculia bacterium]